MLLSLKIIIIITDKSRDISKLAAKSKRVLKWREFIVNCSRILVCKEKYVVFNFWKSFLHILVQDLLALVVIIYLSEALKSPV